MTDFPSQTAQSAWVRLVRGAQGALRRIEKALKDAGHPPLLWYDVLLEIERAPDGRLRQRDIQQRTLLERYSVSRLVERLQREGLVDQVPCAEDGRGSHVVITPAGRALRRAMWADYGSAIRDVFAKHYSEAELEHLSALLGRLDGRAERDAK